MSSMIEVPETATIYGIPRSHWDCYLRTFEWEQHKAKRDKVLDLLEEMEARARGEDTAPAPHIVMTGPPGRGKTHLAVGLYRRAAYLTDLGRVQIVHVPTFCDEVKRSYDGAGEAETFGRVERADFLLVLDDLSGRELTPWERDQILSRLIITGYRNNAILVVTMNQKPGSLKDDLLSQHEMSRLQQNSQVWGFGGPDRRLG